VVLDDQPSSIRLIGEAQLDPLRLRVVARVGESLLRHAEERERGLRIQRMRRSADLERGLDPGVAGEVGGQPLEALGPRQVVVAQRADRAPGLFEAAPREPVGAVQGLRQAAVRIRRAGEHARALQLEHEPGERMSQHVVHLAGDAAALVQSGRFLLGAAAGFELREQPGGLLVRFPHAPGEDRENIEGDDAELRADDQSGGAIGVGTPRGEPDSRQPQQPEGEARRQAQRRIADAHEQPRHAGAGVLRPHEAGRRDDQPNRRDRAGEASVGVAREQDDAGHKHEQRDRDG
jgi:hypothetical protein